MHLRLTLTIVLLLIAPTVCSTTAYADPVTADYVESREMMIWTFSCNILTTCAGSPANRNAWAPSVAVDVQASGQLALTFQSFHRLGPHTVDQDSRLFSHTISFAELGGLPFGQSHLPGSPFTVVHLALFGDHHDIYDVLVTRNPGGSFDFVFGGQHVPEPATLFLLGTGLTGIAMRLRKRRKNKSVT